MRTQQFNPSSIHVRVGTVQSKMDDAAERGDVIATANLLGRLRTYCATYMTPQAKGEYDRLPGLTFDDKREPWQVMQDLRHREEYLNDIFREFNIGGKAKPEYGDASALDEEEVEA